MIKKIYFLCVLTYLCWISRAGLVRVPKIYNAIVSSKQNLSPSRAIPVIQPVYSTSALGVAFPPAIIQTLAQPLSEPNHQELNVERPSENKQLQDSASYPFGLNRYYTYSYQNNVLVPNVPNVKFYNQQPIDRGNENNRDVVPEPEKQEIFSPQSGVRAAIDFQKNPEVPDVPIPAIPVRIKS